VVRVAAIALFTVLVLAARAAPPPPSFSVQPGGIVAASLPASILSESSVRKQLGSGLTTTFLLVVRDRNADRVSGARIEVRYDLWDEVWIVRRVEFDRRVDAERVDTFEALERWWRAPVRVLATDAARLPLQIDLTVLPFSAAESNDAREWISKSAGVGTASGGSGFVDVLIGTTIAAKPITSYRWNVELAVR
jgi:hypothetical protein